jgi:HEPN domain-containing protein
MALDPAKVDLCREWFTIAASDLRASRILAATKPALLEQALYLCQQTSEKALKGFLTWHDVPLVKTHDLAALAQRCAEIDPSLRVLVSQLAGLTAYGSFYRYPGGSEIHPTADDADHATEAAADAMRIVLARLPPEVAP